MLCSLVKNAEHGAIQDEAERMYVLEETVLCMVESLHFLRKLCNVVGSETGEAHLRNRSECTMRPCVENSRLLVQEYMNEFDST